MNSNMSVGPSFKGTLTLKTVEMVLAGRPIYTQKAEVIRLRSDKDSRMNSALAFLLGGDVAKTVTVDKNRLTEVLEYISGLIKKPLDTLFPIDRTVASGDVLNPKNMKFRLITQKPKVGDVHLFWRADEPYNDLIEVLKYYGFRSARELVSVYGGNRKAERKYAQ